MSTNVFQGLQSCVEPQIVETRSLRLKLSSPKPESSSWNITQSLSNSPTTHQKIEPSHFYPMTKNNSYSKLSNKSLELCTENLGCETGTDMIENSFFSLPSREPNGTEKNEKEQLKLRQYCYETRKKKSGNFPPPLTTMVGSNALQMRPIREGGRLVIQAVEAPSSHVCFQAERSNGRLRLSLFRDAENYDNPENGSCKDEIKDMENEVNCEKEENVFEEMDEEEEEEEQGVKCEVFVNGDLEGNNREIGGEMGFIKFQRPIWCKEGGGFGRCSKGLCNWEPFWVATS